MNNKNRLIECISNKASCLPFIDGNKITDWTSNRNNKEINTLNTKENELNIRNPKGAKIKEISKLGYIVAKPIEKETIDAPNGKVSNHNRNIKETFFSE